MLQSLIDYFITNVELEVSMKDFFAIQVPCISDVVVRLLHKS